MTCKNIQRKRVTMFLLAQLPAETLLEQLKNGLVLLVLGMSIVFVFLTILVFTTKGVSKVVRKFEKSKPVAQAAAPAASSAAATPVAAPAADAEIAVAIAAAVAKSKS